MDLNAFVEAALEEDVRDGDHTSLACIPEDSKGSMYMLIKQEGVLAGIDIAAEIFKILDPESVVVKKIDDGTKVGYGDIALTVSGRVHKLLIAERLVLNIAQRMSGIATKTRHIMDIINGTKSQVLDTRKTTPLFRYFEKEAVRIGGGTNHRMGLYDAMMIKDNHIDFAGGITQAIERCVRYQEQNRMSIDIIVESRNLSEVEEILTCKGVRRILLDNFTPEETQRAVDLIAGRVETESSGGMNEENIKSLMRSAE